MKLDKETVITMLVCITIVIMWGIYSKKRLEERAKNIENIQSVNTESHLKQKDNSIEHPVNQDLTFSKKEEIPLSKNIDLPSEFIQNEYITCEISPTSSSIKSIVFNKYLDQQRKEKIAFGTKNIPFDALQTFFGRNFELIDVTVQDKKPRSLTISRKLKSNLDIIDVTQSFYIEDEYTINSQLFIKNSSEKDITISDFMISAGTITNFNQMAGDNIRQEYFSIDSCLAAGNVVKTKAFNKTGFNEKQENPSRWIALSNKYFCSILKPADIFEEGNIMEAFNKANNIPCISSKVLKILKVKAGESKELKYSLYVGPKERKLLKKFDDFAVKIMHLGWNWLEPISQLLLTFLVLLNKYIANYGLSIIVLTILVKLIFWPVTEKANSSMKNMQKIQPMVLEIKEKYKNDPQKMNMKIMELYKEHGVNPLGGCLPILLQIPVFFALYNTLNGAIELRQASFLWAHDLSRPDSLFIPGIPLPINPLVLAMAITMFIQQKLTPSSGDPTQQKIMAFMPLIMLFLLYSLPSGLTLYWTVSQVISIIQLVLSKYKPLLKKEAQA